MNLASAAGPKVFSMSISKVWDSKESCATVKATPPPRPQGFRSTVHAFEKTCIFFLFTILSTFSDRPAKQLLGA